MGSTEIESVLELPEELDWQTEEMETNCIGRRHRAQKCQIKILTPAEKSRKMSEETGRDGEDWIFPKSIRPFAASEIQHKAPHLLRFAAGAGCRSQIWADPSLV